MRDAVVQAARGGLEYGRKLVADIPPEKMCYQPAFGMNHPTWILGHLAFANHNMGSLLGHVENLPSNWKERFGIGSKPVDDRALYPTKSEMWDTFEGTFLRAVELMRTAPPEAFEREFPDPKLRALPPTVGAGIVFVLTTHTGTHLGQLSAWRRVQGLPGVLGM